MNPSRMALLHPHTHWAIFPPTPKLSVKHQARRRCLNKTSRRKKPPQKNKVPKWKSCVFPLTSGLEVDLTAEFEEILKTKSQTGKFAQDDFVVYIELQLDKSLSSSPRQDPPTWLYEPRMHPRIVIEYARDYQGSAWEPNPQFICIQCWYS